MHRYSRDADWDYISRCAAAAPGLPLIGNGDVYNWEEYAARVSGAGVATAMIARSALIKPWIFTEIKVSCVCWQTLGFRCMRRLA